MIRQVIAAIVYCLGMGICLSPQLGQAEQDKADQAMTVAVGKADPFAALPQTSSQPALLAMAEQLGAATALNGVSTLPAEPKPELFVTTSTLKFLRADNLKAALTPLLSEYGMITVDKITNSLIVCDTKETLEKIALEIAQADKTPRQIMIEVVIVDVQLNDDSEIGINWDLLSNENYNVAYRQGLGFTPRLQTTPSTAETIANAAAFATTGMGADFTIITGTIRNVIHMLQQKKNVEVIASPRVMVLSGEIASIEAVEEIPYNEIVDTSEGGSLSSTSFKDVGVKLDVKATLTDDEFIHLKIGAEQKVATGLSDTAVPVVDARKASTSLLLADGQVVVLGGLRRKERSKQTKQVPILGDIPLVGLLFKSTDTVVRNSELIVFVSPHIYHGEPIDEKTMSKFTEISERPMLELGPITAY